MKQRCSKKKVLQKLLSFILVTFFSVPMQGLEGLYFSTIAKAAETEIKDVTLQEPKRIKFADGDGTLKNPYKIETTEQFYNIRNDLSAHYILKKDIDLSQYNNWEPIGDCDNPFTGSLDGDGYVVNNLTINQTVVNTNDSNIIYEKYIGLFGYVKEAKIIDICLNNVSFDLEYNNSVSHIVVGGFVGGADGCYINNCSIDGDISVRVPYCNAQSAQVAVSGIANAADEISYCTNNANIYIEAGKYEGNAYEIDRRICCSGVGSAGMMSHCVNKAKVETLVNATELCVGGISGSYSRYAKTDKIEYCYNYGDIEGNMIIPDAYHSMGSANCYVGGVVGTHHNDNGISYVVNFGNICGTLKKNKSGGGSGPCVGGVIGVNSGFGTADISKYIINNCINCGENITSIWRKEDSENDNNGRAGRIMSGYIGRMIDCYSLDTTKINNEIPTENIGSGSINGESMDIMSLSDMLKNIELVSNLFLDFTAYGLLGEEMAIPGTLTLSDNAETSSDILSNEVVTIKWTSSDQSIVADSEISCTGVNSYDNRSAELMISFTPHKEGKVTITGTASNGLTASCDVSVGGCIAIDQKANDLEGCTIALTGTLTLEESAEASEANLQAAIDSLAFESSDDSKAKVLACNAVQGRDHCSATLEIWTTLYNEGEATITAKASDGHTAKCKVTIQADTSEDGEKYEGDYTSEMREFLNNQGTRNTLKYLCNSSNFTASTFVAEKDAKFGNLLAMALTDTYYRGWDGWKDLIDGSTSVKEAEKILASLLGQYEKKVEGLSETKTAQKYAKMLSGAFSDYAKSTNMFEALKSEEIHAVRKYFSDENLAKLLYEGKYDEIVSPVNQILQMEGINQIMQKSAVFQAGTEASKSWNKMMEGFTQSAEMSKILKKGCQAKLGKLEVGGGLSDIGDALKFVSLSQDALNHIYQLETLLTADEMYSEMLLYVKENCTYSVVQEAAGNLYSVINNRAKGIMADFKRFATDKLGEQALDLALQAAGENFYIFAIIKGGFDWGAALSNTFFKTGSTQELKDSLRSQAFLANCLGGWVLNNEMDYLSAIGADNEAEKGKELYYSLYMLWESRKNAEETLQSLLKTIGVEFFANYSISTKITSALESFQENIFTEENRTNLLGISVSCPVDVEVYNESGTKLLTVRDGMECRGHEKDIYYYCIYNPLSDDYDKYIYYNEDVNYSVKILGNDLGSVDASVSSVNDDGYLNEFYFENTGIDKGTVIDLEGISKEGVGYKVISSDGSEKSETMYIRKADKIATRSISLSADLLELEVGNKQLLTVSFAPANATNQKVAWNSSNEAIVSVNSDGVITAIAAGTAVVTAYQGDLEQTCKITVKEPKPSDGNTEIPSGSSTETPSGGGAGNKDNGLIAKKMTLSKTSYIYNGKAKKPAVTVIDNKGNKISDAYYTVSYRNNKKVGKATVTVRLKNGYSGTLKKSFTIKPKGTKLISLTGKSKSISIKWAKQKTQTTGYQIQYSTNSKFSKKATATKTVKKNTITKLTAKKLKARKTYYVRIRTYKTVHGRKYYSAWSKVKKVKTKK